ncbi:MAG: molybdenum cofactor biosynthesis protein MoaE [Nitrososphaeria archaeon]|jgi:molybdopterin synthase catalytic subunit
MAALPDSGIYEKGSLDFKGLLYDALFRDPGRDGIVLYYAGTVKELGRDGKKVRALYIEAHPTLASEKLKEICAQAVAKFSLNDCRIYHLKGTFHPGELLVLALIWSRDRSQALSALPYVVERYKKEPLIWKKEIYEDNTEKWIVE